MRHWMVTLVVAASLLAPRAFALEAQVAAQQDQRCFSETGQCISGRFRQYWEQNGGLAVFGLPLTAAVDESNADGKTYLTQWFERNRFELHTDQAAPYDVLLGRLGDDRLRQQNRDWQQFPKGTQQVGCAWFAETGHTVCEPFKSYWEQHGLQDPKLNAYGKSLALFGLPLGEATTESNAAGATVVMQWFERARFECFPNNPPEYRVLLGLLGAEVRSNPPIAAATAPVACTITTPTPPTPAPGIPAPRPEPAPRAVDCFATPAHVPNVPVQITRIDKSAEIVYLKNVSAAAVNLEGWTMCSITGGQEHIGIGGSLQPGQTRAFQHQGSGNIWNNNALDPGALYDALGRPISYR